VQNVAAGIGITATPNPIINAGTISLKPATNAALGGIIAGSGTSIDGTGLLTVAAAFNGGTVANLTTFQNGVSFGSTQVTGVDLSKHIALYGTQWGMNVISANIQVVANSAAVAQFNATGIQGAIGASAPNTGSFTNLLASGSVAGTGFTNLLAPYSLTTHTHLSTAVTDFAEAVDDRVAALLVQGANTTLTYNDAANTLTIASTGGGGIAEAPTGSGISYMRNNSGWVSGGTLTAQLFAASGSITAPGISFAGDANTGFYRTAGGIVRFAGAAADVVQFNGTPKSATFYGPVILGQDPAAAMEAVTSQYLDAQMTTIGTSPVGYFQAQMNLSPPTNGNISWNNIVAPQSATQLYISKTSGNSTDISYALGKMQIGWVLRIQLKSSNTRFVSHNIIGTPTDSGTYFTVPVSQGAEAYLGMPFAGGSQVVLTMDTPSSLGSYLPLSGGTMTGQIGLPTGPSASQAVRKDYVDTQVATKGSVSSVSFTGGLISVATPTTTAALTVAGISGGIPYFNSASTWSSSGVQTYNAFMFGGGSGFPPLTNPYYNADGTGNALFGQNQTTVGSLTLYSSSVASGYLAVYGLSTGAALIKNPGSATTSYNFNLPTTAGTTGQYLMSQGGGNNSMTWSTPGGGGLTSVGQTFTGGIISVAGSPITVSGNSFALTVAGTAGGVPYFDTATSWASTAALTNNNIVLGGGATGPKTSNYITTDGVTTLILGQNGAALGVLRLTSTGSGYVNVQAQGSITSYSFNLPIASGTAGQVLTSQGGGGTPMTWTTPGSGGLTSVGLSFTGGIVSVANSPLVANGTLAMTVAGTPGGVPFFSSASAWATSAQLVQNAFVLGGGAGFAPGTNPYFNTDGTAGALFGAANSVTGSLVLQSSATTPGYVAFTAKTSGAVQVRNAGTAITSYNFNLPDTAGTAGQVLTSQAGAGASMTWTTPAASGIPEAPTGSGTSYIRTDSAWTSGGKFTSPLQLPIGSSSAVALNFGTTNTGLYQNASGYLQFTIAGSSKLQLGPTFVNILQQAQAVDGSQGAPSYAFASEIQSGMYWASANNVRITVQSTDVVNFSGTGGRNSTFYGPILTQANPATALEVANKQYTDNRTLQTITVSNSSADTMPTGVYDLGVFWVATTVNSSVAHVTSGTGTYTLSLGAVGSLTAITGISGVTTTGTADTTATASALNVASAGQHLWLTISGTAAPGFCVSVKATVN
jgi:hypothetical protein